MVTDFEFATIFFFEGPAFAAPEEEVDYDGVVEPKSQVGWDFVVSEYVSVEGVVCSLGLVDSLLDVVGVVELWCEVRAEVFEAFAKGEELVFVEFDVGCVVFGGYLSWRRDVHGFCF